MLYAQKLGKSFWLERWPTWFTHEIGVLGGYWTSLLLKKGRGEGLHVFRTSPTSLYQMRKRINSMPKGMKCLFLGNYEGTKAYRLMCLHIKKIIKSRDVIFMEDNTNIGNDLEMCLRGRIEGLIIVVVDESSKSSKHEEEEESIKRVSRGTQILQMKR